jgi:hypothetical protein
MARRTTEVIDEFADAEFDEVDNAVEDITPVQEVHQVEDLGATEVPVPPPPTPTNELTTTESILAQRPQAEHQGIEDLGVQTIEPDADTWDVAVTEDIGPVFYGMKSIEMKKGRLYRVTADVYEYLFSRGKLVGQ